MRKWKKREDRVTEEDKNKMKVYRLYIDRLKIN